MSVSSQKHIYPTELTDCSIDYNNPYDVLQSKMQKEMSDRMTKQINRKIIEEMSKVTVSDGSPVYPAAHNHWQ